MGIRRYEMLKCNCDEISSRKMCYFCRDRIANYKIPKYFQFVEEFPLNAVGKVQKFRLKEMLEPNC